MSTDQIVQGTKSPKAHSFSGEAFSCMRRCLIRKKGYTEIGSRKFSPPDGGPVLVLTKKSHYGGLFIPGKSGEKSGGYGKRFMPEPRRHGNRGTII